MVIHRKDPDQNKKKFITFIFLSLLLHAVLIFFPWPKGDQPKKKVFIVDRIILDDKDKKQIVDDTKMANREKPDDSKYLSKEDNRADEEIKAKTTARTKNNAPTVLLKPDPNITKGKNTPKKKLSLADLGLTPSQKRTPSAYTPPSATDDYLPEVKEGAQTALNTREFKFYSYFERIKDRLRMYWEPQLQRRVSRIYATGQNLPEFDLITKLNISLNKNGELSKISITRNSGYEEIDLAAVKAFELAAPFPNPPMGMIEKDGQVYLTWSFVVQTKGIGDIFVFLSRR